MDKQEVSAGSSGTLHLISMNLAKELSHGVCVSSLCLRVARELKLGEDRCRKLAMAGMLHDIGKLRLEKYVYGHDDTLTVEEMRYVRMHAQLSADIVAEKGFGEDVAEWIRCHHENCDGTGYPRNLRSAQIPLEAKIIRVCDVFAALTADRIYRSAFDVNTAVDMMIDEAKFYDIKVFLAFLRVVHSEGLEDILDRAETEEIFSNLLGQTSETDAGENSSVSENQMEDKNNG